MASPQLKHAEMMQTVN